MLAIEFNQFQANFFAEISMETDGGGGIRSVKTGLVVHEQLYILWIEVN